MKFFGKKEEILEPFTIEQCTVCNRTTKRKFRDGDYVFKMNEKCSCGNGQMMTAKIFGEPIKS